MRENIFDFLVNRFSSYQIDVSKDGMLVEIINPFYKENIRVEYDSDNEFTSFIVYFAFQHCHMNDEDDIIEYINDIINGNKLSIEFFRDETRCFGGDISAQEIKELSYESLEQYSGYFGLCKLKDLVDSFKLRGWDPADNVDAVLVINEDETVSIKNELSHER